MASFMALPEELRDSIIEIALLRHRTPRPDIERGASKRNRWNDGVMSWDYGPENVHFETTPIMPNSSALLLVNQSVHEQTKKALARLFPNGMNYKLDVMLMNELRLWPTWLQVPAFSSRVDTVDVTVRIVGRNTSHLRSAFITGDGSPEQIVWVFYWLMENFLDFGVANTGAFKDNQSNTSKVEVSVKRINLDFVSEEPHLAPANTEDNEQKWWARQRPRLHDRGENLQSMSDEALLSRGHPLRMHPKWLAEMVGQNLTGLVDMGYHDAEYGRIIYERVGCVKVYSQGDLVNEVNPGALLPAMVKVQDEGTAWYSTSTFGHLSGGCRLLTFWNWKYQTVLKRQRLGLPLEGTMFWPTLDELKFWRASTDCSGGRCLCRDRRLEEMLKEK